MNAYGKPTCAHVVHWGLQMNPHYPLSMCGTHVCRGRALHLPICGMNICVCVEGMGNTFRELEG
eukprot:c32176_g1_i1 orf=89-280(+)